jgi:low affinity Fe/Cu permease
LADNAPFIHKKTTKAEALRFFIVAVAISIIASFALQHLVKASEQVIMYIQLGIYIISLGVMVVFVIPNLLKKGYFEFYIDHNLVRCKFPDNSGYEVKMADIDQLEKHIITSIDNWVDYRVRDKKGKSYSVPTQFALSPHKVFAEIKKHLPELKVVKKVNY